MDSFGRLVVIMAAVIAVTVIPFNHLLQRMDEQKSQSATALTAEFADRVCRERNLSKDEYERFLYKINAILTVCDIHISAGGNWESVSDIEDSQPFWMTETDEDLIDILERQGGMAFQSGDYFVITVAYGKHADRRIVAGRAIA